MARVLVTGGAGLIGSHLAERLIARGDGVVVVDDFSTGSEENLLPLYRGGDVEVIRADVAWPLATDVDAIYHMACPASPVHFQRDPIRTIETTVQGTRTVLELARMRNIPILIASTGEIYGEPRVHPQSERYWGNVDPVGPRACYREGKRCAEALAVAFAAQHRVDARIVRIFDTYGPRMRADGGRVIPNFVIQALAGRPLTIHGDGQQTRSYCYVSDLVDGLVGVMELPANPGPVNLGCPAETTVIELAEIVLALTGSRSPLAQGRSRGDGPTGRRPDTARARALLGWQPRVPLEHGLLATIEDFRRRLGQPLSRAASTS